MRTALKSVWLVIATAGIIQTANALQTDLLGVRAGLEAFPAWALGVIMACYYIGYSAGPLASHSIVARFGHVVTIIVFTLVAGLVIYTHGVEVTVVAWSVLRIASGFALAIVFVGYESWINERADNRVRGRVFGLYLVSQMTGMTFAQVLLNVSDPKGIGLFELSAILFIAAAIPIWFARDKAPAKAPPVPFSIFALARLSPMGAAATVLSGVSWSIVFTFGPSYAQRADFSISEISLYMGMAMVGGALMQFPLGWISDAIGRRATIFFMSLGGTASSLLGFYLHALPHIYQYIPFALIGALVLPLYGLAAAHTNDRIESRHRVAAAASLVLLFGLGSIFGPLIVGSVITAMGAGGFFVVLAAVMGLSVTATALPR
ncbi:MAG TPA: MFS transporter [Rhizomicrobium sp.]|nr:MFS transporter [Rhizomicrobium sp.]